MKRQAGVTAIGWVLVLALIGFFVFLTLKMLPVYLEYFKVVSSLESLENESLSTPGEIRKLLDKRFDIDYVNTISAQQVKIINQGEVFNVIAKYDSRVHLFANIDVLMSFDKQVRVAKR
jgi:DNA-dependent RNA polymerase auxiliary subunit epsilon